MATRNEILTNAFFSGVQGFQQAQQEGRMRDIFEFEKGQVEDQKKAAADAMDAFQSIFAEEQQFSLSRAAGAKVLSQIKNLAAEPASVRKANAPVLFQAYEEQFGKPIAQNVQDMILKGKSEEVLPIIDSVINDYTNNPNLTVNDINQILSNPLAAAQVTGSVSRETQRQQEVSNVLGPQDQQPRNRMQAEIAKIERLIQEIDAMMPRLSQVPEVAKVAQETRANLVNRLERMTRVLSPEELQQFGFFPGTVAVETGMGEIKILQSAQGNVREAVIEGFDKPVAVIERGDGRLFFQDGRPVPMDRVRGFLGVVEQTTTDAPSLGGAVTKGGAQKEREERIRRDQMRERLGNFYQTAQKLAGGASGLKGLLSEKAGGLVGQIPILGPAAERELVKAVSGMTPEQVQEFRTEAIALIGPMVPVVTGDDSGRYSDRDVAMAKEAQKALDPGASAAQVVSAAKIMTQLAYEGDLRFDYLQGVEPRIRIDQKDGAQRYVEELMDLGFSKQDALESLKRNLEFLKRRGLFGAAQ
jgi:predicted transcriptional regulator